jgi:molybdopterin synthase catalytic subunit
MSTALESKIRIQREDFSVTDEIEFMKKSSRNIGGITTFLGTGRELTVSVRLSTMRGQR